MKGTHRLLIVIFIFQLVQAAVPVVQAGAPSARKYDFIYFVQQWQMSLCNIKPCLKPARPAFSIHGLWPSSYSGKPLINYGNGSKFDQHQISDVENRLKEEWPSLLHENDYKLWKDEWERHGICSESILPQHAFFEAALKLKGKYRLVEMLAVKDIYPFGDVYSLDSIADAIRASTGHNPQIECRLYKQIPLLSQIFLCFDYNATEIIDCPLKRRCKFGEVMIPFHLFGKGK